MRNFESQNEYGYKSCIKRRFQNANVTVQKSEEQFLSSSIRGRHKSRLLKPQDTQSHWVTTTQARMPDQQRNELEELKRLRLQVRKQQAEIDFLKKAAAYFAKLPK